jgi:protein TonB
LKQIDENARKERIENERKQNLEDEAEKAKEAEEAKRKEEDERIYDSVDIKASFPGGSEAWKKYMDSTFRAQVPVDNGAPDGTYIVYVQFVVANDGTIRDVKALTYNGYGMEAEAIRVIRKQPKWIPAVLKGKNVSMSFKQPFTFQITSE